ncbi:MAG: 2-oxo acid dehydrogenase subunit E2, partial [Anaerolineales bacterium]|nr:2-oxo acid dehydrogenase subunit E2 [Anaerolineales bacterium]
MAEVVTMPKLGFDMAEGVLVRWVIAEGAAVERGNVLAEIETDKATVEVESAFSGIVHKHLAKEGDVLPVNEPIAVIREADEKIDLAALLGAAGVEGEAKPAVEPEVEPKVDGTAVAAGSEAALADSESGYPDGVKASPVARRMAEEHGLDLTAVRGSGPGGRIVKKDIEAFLAAPPAAPDAAAPAKPAQDLFQAAFSPVGPPLEDKIVPTSKLRQAIGRRLVEAKQQLPHFYVTYDYDMGPLMDLRQEINAMLESTGEKLSVNDFIVKAAALALRQYPNLNASLKGTDIIQHGQVNIGIAVAVPGGLLTVVVR